MVDTAHYCCEIPSRRSPIRHYLKTLGEPALLTPAGRTVPFRTRKALALLVYLAVEPRPHPRDLLAEMFWSRTSPSEARHSLANAISEIRRRLGKAAVETALDRVRLRGDVVALDLERLLAGDVLGTEVDGPLEVDGFLEGFDLPDATGFALWKEAQRGGLVTPLRDALVKLIDRARRTGNFPELGRLGERLARFDELSEDAIRARMESRAFAGDRLGALRLYEQWKTELANQMGAMPSDLLEGMSLRLRRRGWERPGGVEVPAVRTEHWRDRAFVGREAEFRELYDAWESTQKGEPRHRLLMGDSGVGKSTLVERVCSVAGLEGAVVVRTQCHELEQELPYGAISELILQLVDRPGASATPPEHLAELAQHIPAIHRRFPNLPTPLATQGEAARIRFSDGALALTQAVAEEHSVILVVDDVHNCDDVSLAVLNYVLRRARHLPLLALLLARPGELRRSLHGRKILEQGEALGVERMNVPPLPECEIGSLLAQLLSDHDEPDATTRRALIRACGGVPLVLELLVREWHQSDSLPVVLQLDAITAGPNRTEASDAALGTYRVVVDRIIASLDSDTRMVLNTATILGRHLNDPGMYAIADLTASQMMHGLGRLTDARILRDAGTGLEFANDLVRAQAYMSIPLSLRRLLHSRVAECLLARAERGEQEHGLDIAWHSIRCGRTKEAMEYLLAGANDAVNRGAVHEAEFRLGSAMDLLEGQMRTDAVLLIARILQEQARWTDSLDVLSSDAAAAQTDLGDLYRRAALVGSNQMLPSELLETIEMMKRLAHCRPTNHHVLLAIAELADLIYTQTYDDALLPDLLSTFALIEQHDLRPQDKARIQLARLKVEFNRGMTRQEKHEALQTLDDLIRQTNAREAPSRLSASLLSGLGVLKVTLGEFQGSLTDIENALAIAQRLENAQQIASGHLNLALTHGWLGNHNRQRELASAIIDGSLVGSASLYASIGATYEFALASIMLGDHSSAKRAVEQQRFRLPSTASLALQQTWLLLMADIDHLLGDEERALRRSVEALGLAKGGVLARRTSGGAAARAAVRILRSPVAEWKAEAELLLQRLLAERHLVDTGELLEVLDAWLCIEPQQESAETYKVELEALLGSAPPGVSKRLMSLRPWTP